MEFTAKKSTGKYPYAVVDEHGCVFDKHNTHESAQEQAAHMNKYMPCKDIVRVKCLRTK